MLHVTALVAVLRFAAVPAASLRVAVSSGVLHELLEHRGPVLATHGQCIWAPRRWGSA